MDSLTHGLLGLALGAVLAPRPGSEGEPGTYRAVLLAAVLAAELPDLDYLWPASDPVLHALRAHRGLSHSLLVAPLVAAVATGLSKLVFKRARSVHVFGVAFSSVVFAHLLADAWTGWGTRLFLPFSNARVALDWMLVVDPLFTLPLLAGALWSFRARARLRRSMAVALAVSCLYLAGRIGVQSFLARSVGSRYPTSTSVAVFPSWLGPFSWRYVAVLPGEYAAGSVRLFSAPLEQARVPRADAARLSGETRSSPTVAEALAWARFPVLEQTARTGGGSGVRIADLRYHLNGEPTLSFEIELDRNGDVSSARLDRGGSAASLLERLRGAR